MEAWAAIQYASAVLGIVDFGSKVLSLAHSASKGDSSLEPTTEQLKKRLEDLRRLSSDAAKTGLAGELDEEINTLYQENEKVIQDLIEIIHKICKHGENGPSKSSSVREAVLTLWNEKEIGELQSRLEQSERRLPILVIAAFSGSHDGILDEVKNITKRLNQGHRGASNLNDKRDFTERLLDELYYREMDAREYAIRPAHKGTDSWVFKHGRDGPGFVGWMEDPESKIFWITGKPGSGKSTLMKFIVDAPETWSSLRSWAREKKALLLLTSYFWISGSELQRTQAGFLRRLLHQAIIQHKGFGPEIFKERLRTHNLLGPDVAWMDPWTESELQRMLVQLVKSAQKTMKVAILIDGLDEHGGTPEDIINLVERLCDAGSNIKLCLSSRYWNEFRAAFWDSPNLKMEDLNGPDIIKYVAYKISQHPRKFSKKNKAALINDIQEKAEGVFLWVYLVTGIVLDGFNKGLAFDDLRHQINSLPQELKDLFRTILGSPEDEPERFRKASEMLQIVLVLMELFYAMIDSEKVFQLPVQSLTEEERDEKIDEIKNLITYHTRCLLEVAVPNTRLHEHWSQRDRFEFIHRSVRDYLVESEVLANLKKGTEPTESHPQVFKPTQRLSLAQLGLLKQCMLPDMYTGGSDRYFMMDDGIEYLVTSEAFGEIESSDRSERDRVLEAIVYAAAELTDRYYASRQLPDTASTGSGEVGVNDPWWDWGSFGKQALHSGIRPGLLVICGLQGANNRFTPPCWHNYCYGKALPLVISAKYKVSSYLRAELKQLPAQCREQWSTMLFAFEYFRENRSMTDNRHYWNYDEDHKAVGIKRYQNWLETEGNNDEESKEAAPRKGEKAGLKKEEKEASGKNKTEGSTQKERQDSTEADNGTSWLNNILICCLPRSSK
ncbi:hypothetical protein QBC38DRAFT_496850 [Podospora fimiseda]|uniref:NACHT domain-containing protein n=1 Tax=Podospora fimiseda TaxID=252190 RepID=A0AAN7BVB2_9PEZI|nr:hypothetical protein QBC38DRAFT_496850 [Podospora fimiseda]